MRSLLVLLAAVVALPAQGQAQFVAACAASGDQAELGVDLSQSEVCGCAAERAMTAGVAAADLDAMTAYIGDDQTLDAAALPDALQATVEAAESALVACVMEEGLRRMAGAVPEPDVEGAKGKVAKPVVPGASAAATPMTRRSPSGFRLGDGRGAIRATRSGPGAAVRIVE